MKRIQLLITGLLFCCSNIIAQSTPEHRYLKPVNSKDALTIVVSGKSRDYYTLNPKQPSLINVSGPGKLRLITRGQFLPVKTGKMKYEIIYTVDGGAPKSFKANGILKASNASYLNGTNGVPAQIADFEILLGPGRHNIEFRPGKSDPQIAVRYSFTPVKNSKKEWIAVSPVSSQDVVDLVSKESVVSYYRFSAEKPLKVVLNGPTELQVLTRAEFQYKMRGTIQYRVQVKIDGKLSNSYQLNSKRSESTTYKKEKKLVPGKGNEFIISIPRGKHTIEIIPLDKDKTTILGRVLIPKKDVKPRK